MLKQPVADFARVVQWLCFADVPQVGRAVGCGLGIGDYILINNLMR